MTITEMAYDFKLKLDKVDSQQKRNLKDWEVDWFLNDAIQVFLNQVVGGNNIRLTGFEQEQRRIDDVRTLVIKSPSSLQPGLPVLTLNSNLYELPLANLGIDPVTNTKRFDYYQLIRLRVDINKTGCGTKNIGVTQVQHDDLDEAYLSPFHRPSFEWSDVLVVFGASTNGSNEGSLFFYTDDFSVVTAYPEYIKRPNRVWIGTYNSLDGKYTLPVTPTNPIVDCDLPATTHPRITDLAVDIATGVIQSPNMLQYTQMKLKLNE
jgi:hypothetical protein